MLKKADHILEMAGLRLFFIVVSSIIFVNCKFVNLFWVFLNCTVYTIHGYNQGCNARNVNCGRVYSAYILKPEPAI